MEDHNDQTPPDPDSLGGEGGLLGGRRKRADLSLIQRAFLDNWGIEPEWAAALLKKTLKMGLETTRPREHASLTRVVVAAREQVLRQVELEARLSRQTDEHGQPHIPAEAIGRAVVAAKAAMFNVVEPPDAAGDAGEPGEVQGDPGRPAEREDGVGEADPG